MAKEKSLTQLTEEVRRYADLRIDEAKLKATRGLSTALGQTLAYLLIISVAILALGLLGYALLQWLNALLGAPWGTLIVAGVFLLILVVLLANRQRLFRDAFVRFFIDVFYETREDE